MTPEEKAKHLQYKWGIDIPIPILPNIDAQIEDAIKAGGVLDMTDWHGPSGEWCGTTHCRAGWAIHLAGKAGHALEQLLGIEQAACLIYAASRPHEPVPGFYETNDQAWADIQECAARQRAAG